MARAGLSPDVVTEVAARVVNRDGTGALTLARVAGELGVRPPSLYNHVDGLEGLERLLALRGVEQLADVCRSAVMGRAGADALRALADAYRDFARAQPGVYALTQRARPDDPVHGEASQRVLEPVLAVLGGFGYSGDDLIHAARTLRSALHGFVALETEEGFGLQVDVDSSFRWMVQAVERGLAH
ncbi:MAG TPA: TetR-like C-terminal domain-containing protein [Acidimicrobiia bacterium]|nr:TetR-like C-terminal domain-containing protein [Acidimicrobiia bacterium]